MSRKIRILRADPEIMGSYSREIRFKFKGKTYQVTLYWDRNDGYELYFNEGDEDELMEDMGMDMYDDIAMLLEEEVSD